MSANIIVDEGFDKKEQQFSRVLYTGTCKHYFNEIVTRLGKFNKSNGSLIYLTDCSPGTALSYAGERANYYKDAPLVLIVDSEKLEGNLYYNGLFKTNSLNIGSFLLYEFTLDELGKFSDYDYNNVVTMGEKITTFSEDELWQNFFSYFLGLQ